MDRKTEKAMATRGGSRFGIDGDQGQGPRRAVALWKTKVKSCWRASEINTSVQVPAIMQ